MIELNKIIHGDTLETLKTFEPNSIDCIVTSPPYYQLRDYGYSEQWGLEKTYQEYLDKMVLFMAECKRVIKDSGTMWINLGDSYCNNSSQAEKGRQGFGKDKIGMLNKNQNDMPSKSLMLIPHRFAIRCVDELGLILRNDIIWAKPNGMPESVTDRFSKKHEFFFLFVKSQKYYFYLDGVREKYKPSSIQRLNQNIDFQIGSERANGGAKTNGNIKAVGKINTKNYGQKMIGGQVRDNHDIHNCFSENGKNPGDVSDFWAITTKPSSAKHYATFNSELIDKPIVAGCPENGILLDPFAGTGTTLVRALQLNRQVIGIEGSKEYTEIAKKNIDKELIKFKLAI